MDPIGKGARSDSRTLYGDQTQRSPNLDPTSHRAHPVDNIVAAESLQFARQESKRSNTDVASVLIAYGLITGPDCCRQISQATGARYIRIPALYRAAEVCDPADIPRIARTGQIPVRWTTEHTDYATALPNSAHSEKYDLGAEAITTRQELGDALRHTFHAHLCKTASEGLANEAPAFSAARRMTPTQSAVAVLAVATVGLCFVAAPENTWHALMIAMALFFLSVISLRSLVLWPPSEALRSQNPLFPLSDDKLPSYSVFVPLFGEANMVPQLLEALCALDYPAALLDIKLILEKGDTDTLRMVRQYRLPGCMETIVVPSCAPQTKPKALNYALPFASGELLTVFDAEDIPEPEQLRRAAQELCARQPNLACVQARLAFYNSDQNWLTKQFALEYASLFDLILPTLAAYRLPLPLGGTSNHFRTSVLREVGGWDPHNVTEDADLGVRLDRLGHAVGMLDSTTREEAVSRLRPWVRQRSRWLKGWMQTWLVHMRNPAKTWRDMGPLGFLVFQVLMGGIVMSSLVHPFFLAAVFHAAATGTFWPISTDPIATTLFAMQMIVLIAGYGVSMVIAKRACKKRDLHRFGWIILSLPFYWLLLSLAGWFAVWKLITAPFHWDKTKHGEAA